MIYLLKAAYLLTKNSQRLGHHSKKLMHRKKMLRKFLYLQLKQFCKLMQLKWTKYKSPYQRWKWGKLGKVQLSLKLNKKNLNKNPLTVLSKKFPGSSRQNFSKNYKIVFQNCFRTS